MKQCTIIRNSSKKFSNFHILASVLTNVITFCTEDRNPSPKICSFLCLPKQLPPPSLNAALLSETVFDWISSLDFHNIIYCLFACVVVVSGNGHTHQLSQTPRQSSHQQRIL